MRKLYEEDSYFDREYVFRIFDILRDVKTKETMV